MSVLNNLSLYIQTQLNTIATDLGHEVVFYVTDSEQSFDDAYTRMEYEVGNEIAYTPVLLKRIFATKQDDYVYGKYIETYRLEVLGYEKDKSALEAIFDAFTVAQNTNDFDAVDNIKKNHGKIVFVGLVNAKSGSNKHFISYTYEFTWDYVIGSLISDASTLTVDGVSVDFLGIAYQNDKILIPNKSYGSNTLPSTNGKTYAITFPIDTTSTKLKELFNDITDNIYNKSHTLVWDIDGFDTITHEVIVRGGSVTYNRDELISFTVTFEQALPRTTVTIDSVSIPILSFNFNRDYQVESIVQSEELKSHHLSSAATITMRLAHDGSDKSVELLGDIINHNLDNEYTIAITVGINDITHSFSYILTNGTYQFEQTGEIIYEVTFVRVV